MVERMMEIEDELMMILMEVSTFFHGSRCFTGNINLYRPCSISGYDQWKICESYAHCNSYDPMDERHLDFFKTSYQERGLPSKSLFRKLCFCTGGNVGYATVPDYCSMNNGVLPMMLTRLSF
ncbi:uncharacterized protein [Coffea arabica]|uniref:Uncharacterized protein isoform X1 n=1 Tax=Coffea arabica TaxID=13443 RepID=A0ABM4UZV2_COFAR